MLTVWFSFGPDGPALIESVAAFRETVGSEAQVVVFDDASNPLTDECFDAVWPDLYRRTDFPRGGNLRGWSCVFGVLDCLVEACEYFDAPGCLKVDCDTLVLGTDWIEQRAPICGFMQGRSAYLGGMAYWMRRDAIEEVRRSIRDRWRIDSWMAPEDLTISSEALWRFGPQCVLHDWKKRWAGGWHYGRVPEERYNQCRVITFGDRRLIPGKPCRNEARTEVARAMAAFRRRDATVDTPNPA